MAVKSESLGWRTRPDEDVRIGRWVTVHSVCAARVHDRLLGGGLCFRADDAHVALHNRGIAAAERIARAERKFVTAAVRLMLDRGVRQFLDLGAGLPTSGGTWDVVRRSGADARVVHVDHDAEAVAHGRILLAGQGENAAFVQHDAADAAAVFATATAEGLIDPAAPVGVVAVGLLHLMASGFAVRRFTPNCTTVMAKGSALAVTHLTGEVTRDVAALLAGPVARVHPRDGDVLGGALTGHSFVAPGLVPLPQWLRWHGFENSAPSCLVAGLLFRG